MKEFTEQDIKWLNKKNAVNISLIKDEKKYKIEINPYAYIVISNSSFNNCYKCSICIMNLKEIEIYGSDMILLVKDCIKRLKIRMNNLNKNAEDVFSFKI